MALKPGIRRPLRCDQCEASMITLGNVTRFCHETGCPNTNARYDFVEERWIKQRKCFDCGYQVDINDPCCSASVEDNDPVQA